MWIPEIRIHLHRGRPETLHFNQHPWWTMALPHFGDTLEAPNYLFLWYSRHSVCGLKTFLRLTEVFVSGNLELAPT